MPPDNRAKSPKRPAPSPAYVASLAKKLEKAEALREGAMLFRLTGKEAGEYRLECSAKGVRVAKGMPRGAPLLEVMGDAQRIRAIIEGKKDARKQFFAGGLRVRGDLLYAAELGRELGILEGEL